MPEAAAANQTQASSLVGELRAIRDRADLLIARVPDDLVFAWQPANGRGWSVGQCLDHLSQGNRLYIANIRDALANAQREPEPVTAPIRSTWPGRKFIAMMEPGTRKMKAPKKIAPRLADNRAQVWGEFVRGLDEMEAILREADHVDLNRPTLPSPLFKLSRMRVGTAFRILFAHMRRHIRQAERVLETRLIEAPKGER